MHFKLGGFLTTCFSDVARGDMNIAFIPELGGAFNLFFGGVLIPNPWGKLLFVYSVILFGGFDSTMGFITIVVHHHLGEYFLYFFQPPNKQIQENHPIWLHANIFRFFSPGTKLRIPFQFETPCYPSSRVYAFSSMTKLPISG